MKIDKAKLREEIEHRLNDGNYIIEGEDYNIPRAEDRVLDFVVAELALSHQEGYREGRCNALSEARKLLEPLYRKALLEAWKVILARELHRLNNPGPWVSPPEPTPPAELAKGAVAMARALLDAVKNADIGGQSS